MKKRLSFAVHDMNTWGGQDRSTLEIARRLSHRWPVEVCSFTLDDPMMGEWGDVTFRKVRPNLRRPVLLKSLYYFLSSALKLGGTGRRSRVVHATGAVSTVNDVIQVQFIQTAWREIRERVVAQNASVLPARAPVREIYHQALADLNVLFEKSLYTKRNRYIAIAACVAEDLNRLFGISENVHVIHHGVDSVSFRPPLDRESGEARRALREKMGIAPDETVLAFVGAFERKGLSVSIEALSKLSETVRQQCHLVAVGSGPTEFYRAQAARLGVGSRVHFVGHQKEVRPYYWMADLFVLPTLYEPFGLVTLEAMACGLAPIVSQRTGASELITDGLSGELLLDPCSALETAAKISKLVSDKELRMKMGGSARRIAENRSWNRVADEYASALEDLMRD